MYIAILEATRNTVSMKHYSERLFQAWDILVAVVATAAALFIPLALLPSFLSPWRIEIGTTISFVVFAIDLLIRLWRYREGRSLTPGLGMQRGWARFGLALDALAAVPFYALFGLTPLLLLRLVKIYRVVLLMQRWSRRFVRNAAVLRLAFFAYGLMLSAHGIACGWVALRNEAAPAFDRYLDAAYWCIATLTTVGYGDVVPAGSVQRLYATGVMLLGVGVYAYLIGNIASIIANIDPAKAHYIQQRDRLTAFMKYRNLPRDLQHRIRAYHDYLWENRLLYDESTILRSLPPSLSTEVSMHLKRDIIESVPLFQGASDAFIREVALQMKPVVFMPGDTIVCSGDPGREMYFIAHGTAEAVAPDGNTVYTTMTAGDFFGEIALVTDTRRTATVRATDFCDLYRLDKEIFDRILAHYPDIAEQIEARAHARQQRGKRDEE